MVVGAGTGCLPVLCGQELPLALWVVVLSILPRLKMKCWMQLCLNWGVAASCAAAAAWGAGQEGQRAPGPGHRQCPSSAQGPALTARPMVPAELAQIWALLATVR